MKRVKFEVLKNVLKAEGLSVNEFIKYASIDKECIEKWKKEDSVPAWAFVIIRDRKIIKNLEKELIKERRYIKSGRVKVKCGKGIRGFTKRELKEIQSAFWGSNYCPEFTVWVVKRMQNNISKKLFRKILKRDFRWGELASNV
jgi:hypothetical protein